jgi:protein-disulfide isomerase-like protein with CxxC motif
MYSDEEMEFLKAIDRFRCRHGRRPTEVEAFRIAKSLGWEKQAKGD